MVSTLFSQMANSLDHRNGECHLWGIARCDRIAYRSGGIMRFRPNTQASIDHVPGPIIANVAPRAARKRGRVALAGDRKARLASRMATTEPAIGVHNPATSRTPASAPILSGTTAAQIGFAVAQATPQWTRAPPVSSRWTRSPPPGQPSANVENSRCTLVLLSA